MTCAGPSCRQGREACATPMLCSGGGIEADEAIAQFRTSLHRVDLPITYEGPDEGGMLTSPEFWVCGLVCVLCWLGLYVALIQVL